MFSLLVASISRLIKLNLKDKRYKQKISPQSCKTQIKILVDHWVCSIGL